MQLKRHLRTAVVALISGASLVIAFYVVGFDTVIAAITRIEPDSIAAAGILVLLNAILAMLRFRSVLRSFGYRPSWRQIVFAFTIGQVSNQVLFNIIGQSLSRAAALNSAGVPFSISVMATYWERLVAAGLLFILSIASAFFIFLNIRIDLQTGGAYLLSVTGGIALVSCVTTVIMIREKGIDLNLTAAPRFLLRLWPSILLTLAAHATMLAAYAILLDGLQIRELGLSVVAALTIVMFAAALPISFSGWGIRELSAAQALGAVGVDPTVAIAGAMGIGLLGLLVTILGGAIGLWLYTHRKPTPQTQAETSATPTQSQKWTEIAVLGSAILSSILLLFQIRLPLEHGEVTANAADVLALTGLGLLGFYLWSRRKLGPTPAWFVGGLAAISLVMLVGLGLGYLRFGSNNWALLNRGLGWLIIVGYVALGASAAVVSNANASRMVLRIFGAAGATIAVQQLVLMVLALTNLVIPGDAFIVPLRGYAGNSNAFAFQMTMAAACIIALVRLENPGGNRILYNTAFVVIALAIYYSHSRSGLGMLAILLVLTAIFAAADQRKEAVKLCLASLTALIFASLLPNVLLPLLQAVWSTLSALVPVTITGQINQSVASFLNVQVERTSSDSERWLSIIEGWDLWLKHPLLGAGLGGYVQERLTAGREFLVIHSIPVWLMAEMGLVGLIVVGGVFALLVNGAFQLLSRPAQHGWGLGLLIILACMAAAGLVHDLFFQRSFWFLLGLYVAAGFRSLLESENIAESRSGGEPHRNR